MEFRRDGAIYIGEGIWPTRKEQHLKRARQKLKTRSGTMRLSHKEKVLIWAEDNSVPIIYKTLWRTDDQPEAFRIESEYIDYYGVERLTNEVYGRRLGKAEDGARAVKSCRDDDSCALRKLRLDQKNTTTQRNRLHN